MNEDATAGCLYREYWGAMACKKICDPGYTLCPHHLLLAKSEGRLCVEETQQKSAPHAYQTPRAYSE